MSRTLDDRTRASDPGGLALSNAKAARFAPELFGSRWRNPLGRGDRATWRIRLGEHLALGDSRAAVVLHTEPLHVAAYADDFDAAVVLAFPPWVQTEYQLERGSRLLTVNLFFREPPLAADLWYGPARRQAWTNMCPLIGDFLTDDVGALELRKARIDDHEWQRAFEAGEEYLARSAGRTRDGDFRRCCLPAERL